MTNPNRLLTVSMFAGTLALTTGCSLTQMIKASKDQQLTVVPSPLELRGDSVKFTMSAVLPTKMLRKNKIYSLNTFYEYADQRMPIGEVQFKSSDFPNAKTQQPKASKTFAFPYKGQSMDKGNVLVQGIASNLNGKQKSSAIMPIAKGLITTQKLAQVPVFVAYADHGFIKEPELAPNTVGFYFEQGSAKLRTNETVGKKGSFLNAFVADKNFNGTVTIVGTHSPEGRESRNTLLAEQRAKAVEKFYRSQMSKGDYKGKAKKISFVSKSVVQDWTEFADALQASDSLDGKQKQQVLDIIQKGTGTFIEKELQLQQLPFYSVIFNNIYPKLRTAETEVLTLMPKKSDATIDVLAKKIVEGKETPTALNDKELAYAATLTPLLKEKEAIYLAAIKKSDAWDTHNNLAAVYLETAKRESGAEKRRLVEKAMTHLNIANNRKQAPEVYTNIAVANLLKDNYTDALESLRSANQLNPSEGTKKVINTLVGTVEIQRGKYEAAIASLNSAIDSSVVDFNRGIAQVLNKQYDNATASFDEAIATSPNFALAYYGAAVVAARKKNENQMTRMIAKAVKLDGNLRERAINDIEFANYWESAAFKTALK